MIFSFCVFGSACALAAPNPKKGTTASHEKSCRLSISPPSCFWLSTSGNRNAYSGEGPSPENVSCQRRRQGNLGALEAGKRPVFGGQFIRTAGRLSCLSSSLHSATT